MDMTYRQLRDLLNKSDENTLDQSVAIYVSGDEETHFIESHEWADSDYMQALDDGHLYLITRSTSLYYDVECDDSDDGQALASAGFGTDEDYGHYGGDDY